MYFQHSTDIWRDFPELVAGVMSVDGIHVDVLVEERLDPYLAIARDRLAKSTEGEFPEVQAWRRAFSRMGLKPTQYRCASEALLRRFRQDDALPCLHPLIDLCNALSVAFAIPVAAFDVAKLNAYLEVRHATGDERYQTFGGEIEHPNVGEVIFADASRHAHARRWSNRQSGDSAVRETTRQVLIVTEAMHADAAEDVERLRTALVEDIRDIWSAAPQSSVVTSIAPRFEFSLHEPT